MPPPAQDLPRRRPVWAAMSDVFLDSEIVDAWRAAIVDALVASGYSIDELRAIFWSEVCPVLHTNLQSVAGVWDGFDAASLERRILARPAGRVRRWWAAVNGGAIARREWRAIEAALAARKLEA